LEDSKIPKQQSAPEFFCRMHVISLDISNNFVIPDILRFNSSLLTKPTKIL